MTVQLKNPLHSRAYGQSTSVNKDLAADSCKTHSQIKVSSFLVTLKFHDCDLLSRMGRRQDLRQARGV